MFQCKMCSENPFKMFEEGGRQKKDRQGNKKGGRGEKKPPGKPASLSRRDERPFNARSEEEIIQVIRQWEQFVHPRARDFFNSDAVLEDVLKEVAKAIDKDFDPVLGSNEQCVFWYGDVTTEDSQPAIMIVKPGETEVSATFVNRVLAFIFATDESFEQLMKLPQDPFKMSCGDTLCVHLAHVALPE